MALKPQTSGGHRVPVVTDHRESPFERIETLATGVTLRVEEGPDAGAEFALEGLVVSGGRGAGQDVRLSDAQVSEAHFELRLSEAGLALHDLGSRNGTWVGRARLLGPAELRAGASFFVGASRIRVTSVDRGRVAVARDDTLHGMYGASVAMRRLFALARRIAPAPLEVLVEGETGTGKEGIARILHALSGRTGPLVPLNCAAVPHDLAESLLFGHAKGAFTGATEATAGVFEAADGGTLFLDEVGELPRALQPKLLRVLDQGEVVRVGEHTPRQVDVRVVSATHRDLGRRVAEGEFREDLFHRLASLRIEIPPLRERPGDILGLARLFLDAHGHEVGHPLSLTPDAEADLLAFSWPGNVRQLKGVVRRTAYLVEGDRITAQALRRYGTEWSQFPSSSDDVSVAPAQALMPLRDATLEFQRGYCEHLMERTGGDLNAAAELAGYGRRGLKELLVRLGLV